MSELILKIILLGKKYLKATKFFQICKAYKFYMGNRYKKLNYEEKTKRRVCLCGKSKICQLQKLLSNIQISIRPATRFQHWIDTGLVCANRDMLNDALPPNYQLIIDFSLADLMERNSPCKNSVMENNYILLKAVSDYVGRVIDELDKVIKANIHDDVKLNLEKSRKFFERMKNCSAETLEEGLQRILFWSSLFWQTGHTLIGLGRLDKILGRLKLPEAEEVLDLISDFYQEIHRYYAYKSNSIQGDTGQLIVLGGIEADDSYYCNQLTYAFIQSMIDTKLSDPKLLLRVSDNMPEDLLKLGLKCIATGIGSPLLANDEIVVPALKGFGYSHHDACDYVTSACWEPLSYGRAWGRGNLGDINFARIFTEMYGSTKFEGCTSFEDVVALYIVHLKKNVANCLQKLDEIQWEENPLMTLFTEGCMESGKDISEAGSIYHDYGFLTVGLANAIDSLINIKKLVFEGDGEWTLSKLKTVLTNNYNSQDFLRKKFASGTYFGTDDIETIELVSKISDTINEICITYTNPYGGKVKYGFSSPNYVNQGLLCDATLDGRKKKEALAVHLSSKNGTAHTALLNFAGALDYNGNRSNGNVVDFFVSPDLIEKYFDQFVIFLRSAIKVGFFEMQMNVVSSKILIAAQMNPELFPNLIVRVWGFSAYFCDLPYEYQNVLIQRAIDNEKAA